jgi:hypothetical protein
LDLDASFESNQWKQTAMISIDPKARTPLHLTLLDEKKNHKTPAYPGRPVIHAPSASPSTAERVLNYWRQTYDLHYSSLIILAIIAIEKQTLGRGPFLCF